MVIFKSAGPYQKTDVLVIFDGHLLAMPLINKFDPGGPTGIKEEAITLINPASNEKSYIPNKTMLLPNKISS